jgi:type II secretory pathway pseudopilin PulG
VLGGLVALVITRSSSDTPRADTDAAAPVTTSTDQAARRQAEAELARAKRAARALRRRLQEARRRGSPPSTAVPASFTSCDQNISTRGTTCAIAENTFYQYFASGQNSSVSTWDAANGRLLPTGCTSDGVVVICTTSDGGTVRFSQGSVDRYTQSNAAAYRASGRAGP